MKGLIFAVSGLGVGGAAFFGADGPDFDQVVNKSPAQVYAAFSALAQEGTITPPRSDEIDRQVSFRVTKTSGEEIHYEVLFDNDPVVTADLTFEAAGEAAQQTRLTAELDIDAYSLGSAFETEAGLALAMVPDSVIDTQFAAMMNDMVKDVEAGRPLPPLALNRAGVRRQEAGATLAQRRSSAERARREAVRPMIDPNRAAANYRRGRPAEDGEPGGWGR
jgi:hypothetical protein